MQIEKVKLENGEEVDKSSPFYQDLLKEELYFEYLFKKLVKLGDKHHLTFAGVVEALRKKVSLLGLLKMHERVE